MIRPHRDSAGGLPLFCCAQGREDRNHIGAPPKRRGFMKAAIPLALHIAQMGKVDMRAKAAGHVRQIIIRTGPK